MTTATPKKRMYRLPCWVFQIFTNQKQFSKNPVLRSKFLNRLGLHAGRVLLAHLSTKIRRGLLFYKLPKADRKFFNKNGFIMKENFLSPADYLHLKEIIENANEFDVIHPDGDAKNQKIYLTTMKKKHGLKYQYLKNRAHINLLTYVAAKNNNFNFFMNKLVSGKVDPQTSYHTDTFHPTMKSWLYFSDTNPDDGPFCYFPGSHKLTFKRLLLEYKISNNLFSEKYPYAEGGSCRYTKAMRDELGLTDEKEFIVKENTLIIADTFGVHRRKPSEPGKARNSINAHHRNLWPFSLLPGFNSKRFNLLSQKIYATVLRH